MSIQEAPQSAPSEAVQTQGNAGSPPSRAGEANGHDADSDSKGSGADDGALPSSGESDAASQLDEMRAQYEELVQRVVSNPAALAALEGRGGAEASAPASHVERALSEVFGSDDDDSKAWRKGMSKISDAIEAQVLERVQEILGTELGSVKKTLAVTEFERSLSKMGVAATDVQTPEFKKHLKSLRSDPAFRTLEAKRPQSAAHWASSAWASRATTRQGNQAARERVEMAKGAKLNGSAPRGTATSMGKVDFDPRDPGSLARISAHLKNGGTLSDIVRKPSL